MTDKKKVKAGDEEAAEKVVDIPPETSAEEPPATTEPKKRGPGRPKGSTNKKSGETPKRRGNAKRASVESFGRQIVGVHAMAGVLTGLPELAISEKEGEVLAEALIVVSEEYGVALTGKTAATIQLFAAIGMVYGPRAVLIGRRVEAQNRQQARQEAPPPDYSGPGAVYTGEFTHEPGQMQ